MDSLRIVEAQLQEAIFTAWDAFHSRARDLGGLVVTMTVGLCRNAAHAASQNELTLRKGGYRDCHYRISERNTFGAASETFRSALLAARR